VIFTTMKKRWTIVATKIAEICECPINR